MRWGTFGRGSGLLLACLAVNLVHCDDGDEGPGPGTCNDPFPAAASIHYDEASGASDEALERLWDKLCVADTSAALAPAIVAPADGAVLPVDTPFEIRWESGIATLAPVAPAGAPSQARPLRLSFGPPAAHAHMPAVTGVVYLIELRPSSGGSLWAFVKREREDRKAWTPDGAFWEKIVALEGPIELHITGAHLRENVVDEGPYTSPRPVVVRIEGN